MKLNGTVEFTLFDENNNLIQTKIQPMASFVSNAAALLYAMIALSAAGTTTLKTLTGANDTAGQSNINFSMNAAASVFNHGVAPGTASSAVIIGDYSCSSSTSGVPGLFYQAVQFDGVSSGSNYAQFRLKRVFNNTSSVSVTLNECGLYGGYGAGGRTCVVRDTIPGGFIIPAGGSTQIAYNIRIVV